MYTKESISKLFSKLVQTIDISDTMFERASFEYKALGKWIDSVTPDYQISIYPQGSFALGTVVKPITEDDDYDLDLVCEFLRQYGLSAKQLKVDVVKPLLMNYKRISGDIIEKRKCWHVDYEEIKNFHMDIIPAIKGSGCIYITDHDEDNDSYEFTGSNPEGYINWFYSRCNKVQNTLYERYLLETRKVVAQADIEQVKRRKIKTPLQKAIQLLKRHRDIMFENRDSHDKPISILITTIAAQLYNNENDLYDTLLSFLNQAESYIADNMRGGLFYIENPSYAGENFADKWNAHPSRAKAFIEWVKQAKRDLIDSCLTASTKMQMANSLRRVIGTSATNQAFTALAKEDESAITEKKLTIDTSTGMLSSYGSVAVPPNHHFGNEV